MFKDMRFILYQKKVEKRSGTTVTTEGIIWILTVKEMRTVFIRNYKLAAKFCRDSPILGLYPPSLGLRSENLQSLLVLH